MTDAKKIFILSVSPNVNCIMTVLMLLYIAKSDVYSSDNLHNEFRSSLSSVSLLHAVSSNPALLASPAYPAFALQLPLSMTFQVSNSVMTLPNPVDYFMNNGSIDKWIARMLIESFDLEGLSPREVSERISSFSDHDIELWMYAELPYLKIAKKKETPFFHGWGLNVVSFIDGYVNVPGNIFALVFSTDRGLQPGNLISFETLNACSEFVTELQSAWAQSFNISIGSRRHEIFNNAQLGFGFTQRFGHTYYSMSADTLVLDYKKRGVMNVKGDISVKSSGISENGKMSDPGINGYGIKMSAGGILQNNYFAISGSICNAGFMGWFRNLHSTSVHVGKDSVYLYDLFLKPDDTLVKVNKNIPDNIWYGLSPVLSGLVSAKIPVNKQYNALSTYEMFSLGCNLSSDKIGRFGRGYALSFDIESGIDYGKIPVRIGWTYTEGRNVSSTVSVELLNSQLTYDVWYRASGDWLFRAKKGVEIGFCFHVYTGFRKQKEIASKG